MATSTKHNPNNELFTQVEDVLIAIAHLDISLNIARHDEDELRKEYGNGVVEDFKNLQHFLQSNQMKVLKDVYNF